MELTYRNEMNAVVRPLSKSITHQPSKTKKRRLTREHRLRMGVCTTFALTRGCSAVLSLSSVGEGPSLETTGNKCFFACGRSLFVIVHYLEHLPYLMEIPFLDRQNTYHVPSPERIFVKRPYFPFSRSEMLRPRLWYSVSENFHDSSLVLHIYTCS